MSSHETPAEARQRWHTEARERDEAYLAAGPADDSERPDSPWAEHEAAGGMWDDDFAGGTSE